MAYRAADISVIIPVGNGSRLLGDVVRAVVAASPAPGEVVVVDDRVRDGSLRGLPPNPLVRVVGNDGPPGPAAARNAGARAARGPLLFFLDADVFVPPDIFARMAGAYGAGVDAVLGVEAEITDLPNLASRYKNLWMRYTYLRLGREVELFYTSCASINREVFLAAGGLDEKYSRPSVEDTAFGRTLAARGVAVRLEKTLEVEHRKIYNARGVLATAFRRGAALARCVLRMGRRGGGNRTSVPTSFIASVAATALFPAWAGAAFFVPDVAALGAAATLAAIYALNARWLAFLAARRGALLAWGAVFLPLEASASLAGGAWGCASFYLLRRRY